SPKGVLVTHQGLSNYLHWAKETYASASGHGSLLHSPISFDLTVTSLWLPLCLGLPLTLLEESAAPVELAVQLRQQPDCTLLKLTPAHLELLRTLLPEETL